MPNEIAMAVANNRSKIELPSAAHRTQIPSTSARPNDNSKAVAAQARKQMVDAGIKELTLAAYSTNPEKLPYPTFRPV